MTDENTALYFADGRAFGATHAAPALTDAPEVGRRSACVEAIERAEALASDLAHERAAHQLTVLELTAAREEAGTTLQAAQAEIADLKARLLGMTACAADAGVARDAALVREGVALAGLRKAEGIQPVLERLAKTVTGRPYPEVSADLDAQVAAHPGSEPEGDETLVIDVPDIDPATSSIMDWIVEAVSIDRTRATYSPLVALSDLIAEWVEATKACEAFRGGANAGKPSPAGECALERLDTVERMLAMAGSR